MSLKPLRHRVRSRGRQFRVMDRPVVGAGGLVFRSRARAGVKQIAEHLETMVSDRVGRKFDSKNRRRGLAMLVKEGHEFLRAPGVPFKVGTVVFA